MFGSNFGGATKLIQSRDLELSFTYLGVLHRINVNLKLRFEAFDSKYDLSITRF